MKIDTANHIVRVEDVDTCRDLVDRDRMAPATLMLALDELTDDVWWDDLP